LYRDTATGNEAFIEYCYSGGCCFMGIGKVKAVTVYSLQSVPDV
jgi:hypothetical protein